MKRILMLASLLAAGMPLGAQNLGSEYRLKRVIPVEGRQGVAADSNFYYVSGSTALYKYDKQGRLAAKNERPFEGLPLAANHIGDIDVWDGEIYAGIETFDDGRGENIQVAVYDANTLEWKRSIDWEPSSGQVEVWRTGGGPRRRHGLDGRLGRRTLRLLLQPENGAVCPQGPSASRAPVAAGDFSWSADAC
ncbi:MAG: hypothetical protein ACLU9X_00555 [Alistipes shahii]